MPKPLKLVAANDTFGALVALADVLAGKTALFVTAPEVNGLMPEVHGLDDEVADDIALIVESSGSTGVPKRIPITLKQLVASAESSAARLYGDPAVGANQWLLALPTNYVAGLNVLVRSLFAETQPVMMNSSLPFSAEGFARAASLMTGKHRFTSVVPAQLNKLAAAAVFDEFVLAQLLSFDAILVGGQAVPPSAVATLSDLGVNLVETYGSTETVGGCVYAGKPLDGLTVELVDGRIRLLGDVVQGGELLTNDLGEFDADGRLRVLGRADRVVISGGLKVSLERVEALAAMVTGVQDCAASAIQDQHWGERVAVVYQGSPEVADSIATELADTLGPAGRPVRVVRVDRIPKLSNGKTDLLSVAALFKEL